MENPVSAKAIVGKIVEACACPRGGPQGAGDDPPQGRAGGRGTARETGGLPGEGPGLVRAVPGRGRFGGAARPSRGRDRHIQAILPLKGKILNVERARFDKMLSSAEVSTLITALGCGIGREEFDPRQAALPPHHHHDRRRRGRLAHPHAAC